MKIVEEFGAENGDIEKIGNCIDQAVSLNRFEPDIPSIHSLFGLDAAV